MATKQLNSLPPCPFCGAEAITPVFRNASPAGYKTDVCTCSNDGCKVIWDWKPIEAWNTRPIEDALQARIAELEAEVKYLKKPYPRTWYIRKIRTGGRVKIAGHWYSPTNVDYPYDGRLDGLYAVFGTYIDYDTKEYKNFIAYHHTVGYEDNFDGDPRWVNGVAYWETWYRVEKECDR